MALSAEHILDLCSGIGQLGLAVHDGLRAVSGEDSGGTSGDTSGGGLAGRTVGYIERDTCAASLLVARMENQELDHAPVWDDLSTFDARRFAGKVSGVCAGLPCPAYSAAGKRKGNADARAWGDRFDPDDTATWGPVPHALRIIDECGADWAFFENVPQWLTGGAYEPVGEQLWRMGFTRQACLFVAASDIGANHKRNRAFVLAVTESWHPRKRRVNQSRRRPHRRTAAGRTDQTLAHAMRCHRQSRSQRFGVRPADQKLADPGGERLEGCQWREAPGLSSAAAPGSVAQCGSDMGDTDFDLPVHPPARGTDLAAVAQSLAAAGKQDTASDVPPDERGGESRRAAAAACYLARRIWRDWASVARLDPAAMPAAERGVSVAAYGHPYATSDLLRIGGNSVVRPAAAVAFTELWRRLQDQQ